MYPSHTHKAEHSHFTSQIVAKCDVRIHIRDLNLSFHVDATTYSGKPLAESRGEVAYGTSFLDYYAGEAIRPTSAGGGYMCPTPFANVDGSPRGRVMVRGRVLTGVIITCVANTALALFGKTTDCLRCHIIEKMHRQSTKPWEFGELDTLTLQFDDHPWCLFANQPMIPHIAIVLFL